MTQEYTPTTDQVRIEYVGVDPDNVDAVTNADFIAAAMFDRWLAAHDAQIRAEALTLSDKESNELSEVIWNYVEDEDLDAATGEVKSTLEAIAKTRTEQE